MEIIDQGTGNRIVGFVETSKNCKVEFRGNNNAVIIRSNSKIVGSHIIFYANNSIFEVDENCTVRCISKVGLQSRIKIGSEVTFTSAAKIHAAEYTTISIGNNCMIASDVSIFSHDFHPIFDRETGLRINKSSDVIIEESVWIGDEARILKGTTIGRGSVVGLRSTLSGRFSANSLIVGGPAKVVKTDVFWSRASLNTTPPYTWDSITELD